MRRFPVQFFLLSASLAAPTAFAQLNVEPLTPNPTVMLSEGTSTPAHNVSTIKIVNGDWTIKPVYRIENQSPRVAGMLAFLRPGVAAGSNLSAVWYERPAEECQNWLATTWEGGSVWEAIQSIKLAWPFPMSRMPTGRWSSQNPQARSSIPFCSVSCSQTNLDPWSMGSIRQLEPPWLKPSPPWAIPLRTSHSRSATRTPFGPG